MDFIKEWTFNISITLIISTVFSLLAPKGSIGRIMKIVLSAFIIISFLYPFVDESVNISFPEFDITKIDDQTATSYEILTENEVENSLLSAGYNSCICDCQFSVYGDEIYIDRLIISIPDEYSKTEVESYIYENLGFVSEVYYIGE